ncbi:DNA-3-methyladenine glycosylase family protein [Paenibacillus sp. FA6]|uniref:DNA-3-methyladenine glycosylase family protein n=1 Tax=Paenibacillus sp. FA6 TaxID=3413029 RepID=UPI003F65C168
METVEIKCFDFGSEEIDYLKSVDPTLGEAISRLGKVERVIIPDLFTALVYAIVGQLISVKAVHTIWNRMQDRFGEISPHNIAMQTADDIQGCGITMKKAVYIHTIAHNIVQGEFILDDLHELTDNEVIKKLMTLNGVGQWTAEMMLINSMERRDVVSWGDIAIRRGLMKLYGLNSITKEQFDECRLRYSPLGSIASIYLWAISFE